MLPRPAMTAPFTRMTVDEFLAWDSGDLTGQHWQLIDGEPTGMAPASETHGAIQAELVRLIGNHLLARGSPCRVIGAPGNEPLTRSNIWTYTTLPSVQEILAVRSTRMEVELLRRGADGNWPETASIVRPPDALEIASIGLTLPVADIYRTAGLPL